MPSKSRSRRRSTRRVVAPAVRRVPSAPQRAPPVKLAALAHLPTRYGAFRVMVFLQGRKEHVVLVKGNVVGKRRVPVRLHSSCLTGDALFSLKCDCGPQLQESLRLIGKAPFGVLVYLQQEGRGIGLANKIMAYHLQDHHGLDTVDANRALGLPIDARDFKAAAGILKLLGVQSVCLLTNNPNKVRSLQRNGISVVRRIPLEVKSNAFNRGYLSVKKSKLGHFLKLRPA
jgi:GTP cyclohydrolase II